MDYERQYDNDRKWKEDDQEEFEDELRRIEKTMNKKDEDEMNVDRKQ